MAVTYTGNLKLGLPTTGTEPGTWGDVVNQQITTLVDQSVSGTVTVAWSNGALDYTLPNADGNLGTNEARYMALLVPSTLTLTANRNMIVPGTSKMYIVKNATTGGFSVTVKTSGGTGIEVLNGRTMLLYCDGANVITAFDTMNTVTQNGGQLAGLRNRLINGALKIDQRNSGASQTITSSTPPVLAYSVDRWYVASAGSGTITGQQITSGAENRYRFTGGAGNVGVYFAQRIEAASCMDMAGKTATLSVLLSSSTLTSVTWRAYYANTTNTFGTLGTPTRTSIASGTFTISTTEAAYSTQIAIPSAATTGIEVYFTTGALTSGTLTFGDVQFELGPVATTFEQRPYGMELALCQQYFYRLSGNTNTPVSIGYADSSTSVKHVATFPCTMRVVPTAFTTSATAGQFIITVPAGGGLGSATSVPTSSNAGLNTALLSVANTGGAYTAGQTSLLQLSNSSTYVAWSAEL